MPDPLFHDGWRDPGDDLNRTVYYVAWVLGFLGGLAVSVYCVGVLVRPDAVQSSPDEPQGAWLPVLLLVLGLLTMVRTGLKLYPEIRRLKRKNLKADAVVAGAFLTGLACVVLGFERMSFAGTRTVADVWLLVLGVAILAISLIVGLVIAFLPKISAFPRTLENVVVESRYGIDKKLMEIYDHPNPAGEECVPMVRVRTSDGRVLTLKSGAVAYDLASPGMRGTAKIAGTKLIAFQPARRR